MRLDRKVALITGAARGIGAAIAEAFTREGAIVWLSDLDAAGVESTAQRLGPRARHLKLDVRDPQDWHAVLATNLDGVFLGCQMAIRAMPAGGGSAQSHPQRRPPLR